MPEIAKNSRYLFGGYSETNGRFLRWWERKDIPIHRDDIIMVIAPSFEKRPDILAHKLYGNSNLQWVVLQANSIIDVETEFVSGVLIRVPSPERVQSIITSGRPFPSRT